MKKESICINISLVISLVIVINGNIYGQTTNKNKNEQSVFSLLSPSQTGVTFENTIIDTKENNVLEYVAFYQGGGVGIGDLNNDGLPDIYFAGNQVGDKLYLNQGNLKFKDITIQAGIKNKGGWSTGVNIIDINGDGLKDIFVCKSLYDNSPSLRQNELYINNGDMTFKESAKEYQLNDPFRAMHANFFDYDKDGDFDLFLINQPPNPSLLSSMKGQNWLSPELCYRFFENDGIKFTDKTKASGLENVGYGLSSVSGDFNNDGWPDLYVANDYEAPDFFYINNKDGTFTNKANDYLKHISFFSMGTDIGDINNDGLLDLSVVDMVAEDNFRIKSNMSGMNPKEFWKIVRLDGHYQYMYNMIQLNNGSDSNGNLLFSEIGQLAGASSTDWSWSPLFSDFDNNGFQDLFITNGIKKDVRNTDALKNIDKYLAKIVDRYQIKNPTENIAIVREKASLDTLLSFFPIEKLQNYIFKNNGDLEFEKTTESWGLDQPSFSSGAAYGDLDNDGDIDLVVSNVDDVAFVYENNSNKLFKNNYLNIKFKEGAKYKSFYGTRASVYYDGKLQIRELTSSRGYYSTSEDLIHFGFGNTKKIDSLVISWYDGGKSVLHNIKTNQIMMLDRSDLKSTSTISTNLKKIVPFKDITSDLNLNYLYHENEFDDYEREVLLPQKMSVLGPCLAVGDVNKDGFEDFFIGGSVGESGSIFLQNKKGEFTKVQRSAFEGYVYYEDMGAEFFDADLDGDLDLYIASGSNEYDQDSSLYQDRIYINDGHGNFSKSEASLPILTASGSRVKQADYDKDGDIDLFVCGRQVPGNYPKPAESYVLKNNWKEKGSLSFEKVENVDFLNLGMVTDATWTDYDVDGDLDLIIVGEWMPVTIFENQDGKLKKMNLSSSLQNTTGWWYSIKNSDIDGDGDEDYIIGNLGLNYKYKASTDAPFTINYGDFDQNGKNDIILGYYNYGEHYPLRGRSCSSQQVPQLKKDFPTYNIFASANLSEVYGSNFLNQSLEYKALTFESICLENLGGGNFIIHKLPRLAQLSSVNGIVIDDVDKDGKKDIIIAGNMYGAEVETPRNDSSVGLFLKGNGNCTFTTISMQESGLSLPYDVKDLKKIQLKTGKGILVGVNNGPIRIIKY